MRAGKGADQRLLGRVLDARYRIEAFITRGGAATIYQVIIGDNQAYATEDDLYGVVTGLYKNLVEVCGGSCTVSGGTTLNLDPELKSVADYGGFGRTQEPTLTSPAVDAGAVNCTDSHGVPNTKDQRGKDRPLDADYDRVFECDLGAVEVTLAYVYLPMVVK